MPRRLLLLAPLLFALPALAADEPEADTPQKIVDDTKTQFNNLLKSFSSVTDEASATAAVPDIEKTSAAIVAIVKRMEKFPDPPADVLKNFGDFFRKFADDFEKIVVGLEKNNPKAAEILLNATKTIHNSPPPKRWKDAVRDERDTPEPAQAPTVPIPPPKPE